MKVLCIDNSENKNLPLDVKPSSHLLEEGKTYTVIAEDPYGYNLAECPHPLNPRGWWARKRFVPVSEISETEFERNYKKELG